MGITRHTIFVPGRTHSSLVSLITWFYRLSQAIPESNLDEGVDREELEEGVIIYPTKPEESKIVTESSRFVL